MWASLATIEGRDIGDEGEVAMSDEITFRLVRVLHRFCF